MCTTIIIIVCRQRDAWGRISETPTMPVWGPQMTQQSPGYMAGDHCLPVLMNVMEWLYGHLNHVYQKAGGSERINDNDLWSGASGFWKHWVLKSKIWTLLLCVCGSWCFVMKLLTGVWE